VTNLRAFLAAVYFMKVDWISHSKDYIRSKISRWRAATTWIWFNRYYIHSIRRPRKPYPKTKHEVDRMTRGGDIADLPCACAFPPHFYFR